MPKYIRASDKKKFRARPLKRKDLQEIWEARIYEAEEVKKAWKKRYQVDNLRKAYEGDQRPASWGNKDWFTLNLVFSSMRVLRRTVVPKDIQVNIGISRAFSSSEDDITYLNQQAFIRQAFTQYLVTQQKLWKSLQKAYRNAHWSFGVLKCGYTGFMEKNSRAGLPIFRDGAFVLGDKGEPLLEPENVITEEEFFIENVDPEMFLVDKSCGEELDSDGRWCAHKLFKTVQEVKKDPLYRNTARLQPSSLTVEEQELLDPEKHKGAGSFRKGTERVLLDLEEDEIVVLYEIYDLYSKETLTLARGHDKLLIKPEPVPNSLFWGHPFAILKFYDMANSFYPIPVIHNWMGPQFEYNIRRNLIAQHIKRYNRKYLYDANKMEDAQIDQLQETKDEVYVGVNGNPGGIVTPIIDSPIGQEHYFDTSLLKNEFDEISGVGRQQRGEGNADSATEAEISESRASAGEQDDHLIVMECAEVAVQKINCLCEEFLTTEGTVKYTGPKGQMFVPFGPEAFEPINGEFFFEIVTENKQRGTLMVERSQTMQLIELLGSNPTLAINPVIVRHIAKMFPALANNEELIQALVRSAQMQIQMQMAGAKENSKGKDKEKNSRPREVAEKSRQAFSR